MVDSNIPGHLGAVPRDESSTGPGPPPEQHRANNSSLSATSLNSPQGSLSARPSSSTNNQPTEQTTDHNRNQHEVNSVIRTSPTSSIDEIATLQARIRVLESMQTSSSNVVPSQEPQLSSDELQRIRANAASQSKEQSKTAIPDIVPGFKSDPLALPVPRKVVEAIKSLHYIPYTSLSPAARERAERGDDEFVFTANGTLTPKGLERHNERSISFPQWQAAALAVLEETHRAWGASRSVPLSAHHNIIVNLANTHNWEIALEYDIRQRAAASHDKRHDLSTVDGIALTAIASELMIRKASSTIYPINPSASASPLKRQFPADRESASSPQKKFRGEGGRCFRCGVTDHLPSGCNASKTSAGKPTAKVTVSGKGVHSLLTADGKQYCFNWSKSNTCQWGGSCYNYHACSLCHNRSHGASGCKA